MKPRFSIIMPVYNAKSYIEHALADVLGQTFEEFECILVNDKSTDDSVQIIKKIIDGDKRFKIISNKNNLGSSLSRRVGMEAARTDYIIFLDADDRFSCELLESVNSAIESSKKTIDIVTWDFGITDGNEKKDVELGWYDKEHIPKGVYSPEQVADCIFNINPNNVWTKCFRLQLLRDHGIEFDNDIIMGEDLLFSDSALAVARAVKNIDRKLAYYRLESVGSINGTMDYDRRISDVFTAAMKLQDFLHKNNKYELFKVSFQKRMMADINVQINEKVNWAIQNKSKVISVKVRQTLAKIAKKILR